MGDSLYSPIFKKTLLEFIVEIKDILKSKRYEVPEIIITDLYAAEITVSAANNDLITEIMQDFGKFIIQFEGQISKKDVEFFNRLDICRGCQEVANKKPRKHPCTCLPCCSDKKCICDAKCPNCSELLKNLDSKTFVAARYVVEQALENMDADKKEDIDVIFAYLSSLLASAKNYKKR